MTFADQCAIFPDVNANAGNEYEILKAHSMECRLSGLDRSTLADYLNHADHVGKSVYLPLSRLLRSKLKYASDLIEKDPSSSIATRDSRFSFTLDKLRPQDGRLVTREYYQPGQDSISMASLLGATLIGMSAGESAPFLQADGSFRQVRLVRVHYQPTPKTI